MKTQTNPSLSCQAAIIGAGPYGLAAAAHLRAARVETRVFGDAMEFWKEQMPVGMFLRSPRMASHIADPARQLTLECFESAHGLRIGKPIALDHFINYGRWFQQQIVPDLDRRRVVRLERADHGFSLTLDDGATVRAERVVVAAGIALFAFRPPQFEGLARELVSHSVEHRDLRVFSGRAVIVLGGGQSALESAALLHEAGAQVEVIARQPRVRWLDQRVPWLKSEANPLRPLFYPPTDVGPPGLNLLVAAPNLFRRLPRSLQERIAYRSIRPAGAGWLVDRLRDVPITTGRTVVAAAPAGERLCVRFDNASERLTDHVMLGTGFRVDISRYPFLTPELRQAVRVVDGYPELGAGLESSVPGLHFLGAPAARSFGPVCRFVSGTTFTARALTRRIAPRHAPQWNCF